MLSVEMEIGSLSGTSTFVAATGVETVGIDVNLQAAGQFNPSFSRPWIVLVNGVANSASHRQWEVIYSKVGTPSIQGLKSLLDQVRAPPSPPSLSGRQNEGAFEITLRGTPGQKYYLEYSVNLAVWTRLTEMTADEAGIAVHLDRETANDLQRFYRAREAQD